MSNQEVMLGHLESSVHKVDLFRDKLNATDGSGVYNGLTKQEALRIFSSHPGAGDNFTRLIRDSSSRRVSVVDYRRAYSEHCSAVAQDFRLAAAASEDVLVAQQLVRMAEVLHDPTISWEELYKASSPTTNSPIRPYLGWEEYDDKWKTKSTPIFWVDELIPEETERMREYLEKGKAAYKAEYTEDIPEVSIRVSKPLITSRMFQEMRWSANTQPNILEWLENGAVITMMNPVRKQNFEINLLPYAKEFIKPEIVSRYSDEQLEEAHKRLLALHELGHPLINKEFGELKELRDLRLIFHEIYPTTLALSLARDFDGEYLEPMLITAVTWGISDFLKAEKPQEDDYARGEAGGMLGFGLKSEAFEVVKGKYIGWTSLYRALRVIDDFNALVREPMRGNYRRAQELLENYDGMPSLYDIMRRRNLPAFDPEAKASNSNHLVTPASI